VANDFDLNSNNKGKNGQRPARRDVIPFDRVRRDIDDFRPIDSMKAETRGSGPGFWPRSLAGAGPLVLLGIAILCGLYAAVHYKKSTTASLKSDKQLQPGPTSQPSSPVQPLSKPSPNLPATTSRAEGSSMPEKAQKAVSSLAGFPVSHYHPMRYEATHKKVIGGCTGQLELTGAGLHFKCPSEADLNIPVGSILKAHKDGVVLESGEKYHFLIANHTKGQVEAIFIQWLSRVQQFQQQSRKSSF
jgi:hypothetical protein